MHGYELIKAIGERTGGAYSPSPGVIYPTLDLLVDLAWVRLQPDSERKSYEVTPEGQSALVANQATLAQMWERIAAVRAAHRDEPPGEIREAMAALKQALMMRLASGELPAEQRDTIAAAIRAAAAAIDGA